MLSAMLRYRVWHFSNLALIGSKVFVKEAFASAAEMGMRGRGKFATDVLWSLRNLRMRVE